MPVRNNWSGFGDYMGATNFIEDSSEAYKNIEYHQMPQSIYWIQSRGDISLYKDETAMTWYAFDTRRIASMPLARWYAYEKYAGEPGASW